MSETFWAVVPAGGAGTRLWPLSRRASPKFLHDLNGAGRTLIQATIDRLEPLAGGRFLVVTGLAHREAVLAQLPGLEPARVLAEPSPRDSMAAIGLAAALLEREDPDAVMGSFAADHVVADPEGFRSRVRLAAEVASEGWLVTLGIEPTRPATGFGYIRLGDALPGHEGAYAVEEFVEKPASARAEEYVASGRYRWNAGMFVCRPTVLLDLLADGHPEFAAALRGIAADPDSLEKVWPTLPRIAIDHAVAEPAAAAGRVVVVPGTFGWDDIGDFASLAPLVPQTGTGPAVLGDARLVRAVDTTGLVAAQGGRLIAVVGLDDVVVVDTGDALLVTTTARAQDVKQIVEELNQSAPDLT